MVSRKVLSARCYRINIKIEWPYLPLGLDRLDVSVCQVLGEVLDVDDDYEEQKAISVEVFVLGIVPHIVADPGESPLSAP